MKQIQPKNEKVAMTAQRGPELVASKAEVRKLNPPEGRNPEELLTVADQLAGTTLLCRNWKFKNADKHFPMQPLLRRVEKFYQNAKGGPLLVDEPKTAQELEECKLKAKAMRAEKVRYVYITLEMELEDAILQLKKHMDFSKEKAS